MRPIDQKANGDSRNQDARPQNGARISWVMISMPDHLRDVPCGVAPLHDGGRHRGRDPEVAANADAKNAEDAECEVGESYFLLEGASSGPADASCYAVRQESVSRELEDAGQSNGDREPVKEENLSDSLARTPLARREQTNCCRDQRQSYEHNREHVGF